MSAQSDKTLSFIDELLQKDPNNKVYLTNKGEQLLKIAKYDEALSYFDRVLNFDPNFAGSLLGKANTLGILGRIEESMPFYYRILETYPPPDNYYVIEASNRIGTQLYLTGRYAESVQYFDKSLAIQANNYVASVSKGNALASLGRLVEAITIYDIILQNPYRQNDILALNNKANGLVGLGRFDEALSVYNRVLQLDPNNNYALTGKSRLDQQNARVSAIRDDEMRRRVKEEKMKRQALDDQRRQEIEYDQRLIAQKEAEKRERTTYPKAANTDQMRRVGPIEGGFTREDYSRQMAIERNRVGELSQRIRFFNMKKSHGDILSEEEQRELERLMREIDS
jgi:tetratricopeptide (TPR) repeat protein